MMRLVCIACSFGVGGGGEFQLGHIGVKVNVLTSYVHVASIHVTESQRVETIIMHEYLPHPLSLLSPSPLSLSLLSLPLSLSLSLSSLSLSLSLSQHGEITVETVLDSLK